MNVKKSAQQSYEEAGPGLLKMALRTVGYTILAAVMSLFVYFSLVMLSTALFQEAVGYNEYRVADGQKTLVETVYFDENTTYESQKQTATDDDTLVREMITQPKDAASAAMLTVVQVVEQAIMILLLLGLPWYFLYKEGDRDRNLVKHHQKTPTPLFGLHVGLLASIPATLVYLLLILGKCGVLAESVQGVYRVGNVCLLPLVNLIMPAETYPATAMDIGQLLLLFLLLLLLPAACTLAYQSGYRRWFKKKKKKAA